MVTYSSNGDIIDTTYFRLTDWINENSYDEDSGTGNLIITNLSYLGFNNRCIEFIVDEKHYRNYFISGYKGNYTLNHTKYDTSDGFIIFTELTDVHPEVAVLMECKDESQEVILGNIEMLTCMMKKYVDVIQSFKHMKPSDMIKASNHD